MLLELHKAFIFIVILVAFGNFPELNEDCVCSIAGVEFWGVDVTLILCEPKLYIQKYMGKNGERCIYEHSSELI